MNRPEDTDLIWLDEDQTKVSATVDTKVQNAALFVIEKEDHTLGNLIRIQLLRDDKVQFAGYRMPHPLEPKIEIKVQTTNMSTPKKALERAVGDLREEFSLLDEQFRFEMPKFAKEQGQRGEEEVNQWM